jgi:hypothetical protein
VIFIQKFAFDPFKFNPQITADSDSSNRLQPKDYAANKTKAVAWFVSNCGARNGRLDYAKELQKYIQVALHLDVEVDTPNMSKVKRTKTYVLKIVEVIWPLKPPRVRCSRRGNVLPAGILL